jgi:hypothetical protein
MIEEYTVKYRQPGQLFWRKLKRVTGDGFDGGARFFRTVDDNIVWVSTQAEVIFGPQRQKVVVYRMSKEAGQPVQRS